MLIRGRYVVPDPGCTNGEIWEDTGILIRGDQIDTIGPFAALAENHPSEEVIGDGRQLVMPGLIDAHSHGRGVTTPQLGIPYSSLENWLLRARSIPPLPARLHLLISIAKHIRSGFSTMHYIHIPQTGLEEMEEAMEEAIEILSMSGIRFAFTVAVKNKNYITYDDEAFLSQLSPLLRQRLVDTGYVPTPPDVDRFCELFRRFHQSHSGDLVPVCLGPVGPQWCSDELLIALRDLSEETGAHMNIHALQTRLQRAYGSRTYHESLVEHLKKLGLLNEKLTLGHAIWLSDKDIELVARAETSVTHHAGCNLHLGNGIAPLIAYLKAGIEVAMGMDDKPISQAEDGFCEMRLISLLHTVEDYGFSPNRVSAVEILRMATSSAASVVGLGDKCGSLAPGHLADLVLLDCEGFLAGWSPWDTDIREALVAAASASDVYSVVVGGREVFKDGCVLTIDEEELAAELQSFLGKTGGDQADAMAWEELAPHVERFYSDWGHDSHSPAPSDPH